MNIKNILTTLAVVAVTTLTISDMEAKERKLPSPDTVGGMPMNEVISNRHSIREFDSSHAVGDQELGQALWMSIGINRRNAAPSKFGAPTNRSNPTALNWQEIHAYVFDKDGVWKYLPEDHSLELVGEGDHRALVAGTAGFSQEFVLDAPCSIVFVADLTELPEGERTRAMALVDAGIACENLTLACTSIGLATVPRATMDSAAIAKLLGLTQLQMPVMNNPIGYQK